MASFLKSLAGPSVKLSCEFTGQADRPSVKDKDGNTLCLFKKNEVVEGTITIALPPNAKKVDHTGITAELIGQVELNHDRGNHYVFLSMAHELAPAGTLRESKEMAFKFAGTAKTNDTYSGINVKLRYFVRVKVARSYGMKVTKEFDFAVQNTAEGPKENPCLKMEVGIEDCLHIEFEYEKSQYNIADVIKGKIDFLLVRIKIKHMEMQILKRESTGSGAQMCNESEVITQYEIMDGAPMKGETIPIRLFLKPFAKKNTLTPTYKAIHKKFSVKYYLNLVLVDEEDRRYFKQQEIILYRDKPVITKR